MNDKPAQVKLSTSKGDIIINLATESAPVTTKNFLDYVKNGFYNGTIFHRVIPNFMIQGGGFDTEMNEAETGECIQNEAENGLKNTRGAVAMARTSDPHSASAQFFINTKDNNFLNHSDSEWGYCDFGYVTDGMDVVETIENEKTTRVAGHDDVPVTSIMIMDAKVI